MTPDIERAAKAGYEERIRQLFHVEPGNPTSTGNRTLTWDQLPEMSKKHEYAQVQAILTALLAEGKKVLAREPTKIMSMVTGPRNLDAVWRAMWDAAP